MAPEAGLPDGWALVELDDIDSTNAEALRRAQKGLLGPAWIRASSQTSGRGRQGRPWVSKPGNLYCTALLSDALRISDLTQLGFVAGLAAFDAAAKSLDTGVNRQELTLKWPNDLLLKGAKISGILLESTNVANHGLVLAVGIGINVSHNPPKTVTIYETTNLADHGAAGNVKETFEFLAHAFAHWCGIWDHGAGFGLVRETWMTRAQGIGQVVTVIMPEGKLSGRFMRLDDDGAMILAAENEPERRILVGDMFVADPIHKNTRQ